MIKYLLAIMPAFVAAQNSKTYSGTFEKGTAIYQYYEKENGERVYDGKFHYECEDHGDNYPFQSFDGLYSKGQRTGKWVYHYESRRKDLLSVIHKTYSYKNGTLDGEISDYQYIVETKDGVQKKNVNHDYKFSYKNGNPFGTFNFEGNYPFKTLLAGKIDSMGFAEGDWHIVDMFSDPRQEGVSTKFDCRLTYRHGILLTRKTVDTEKGNIIEDYKLAPPDVTDTTYYKVVETKTKIVSCAEISVSECPYKNRDLQEIISKVLPFGYYTITYSYAATKYAAANYNALANTYKTNERAYLAELGRVNPKTPIFLIYSGTVQGISKERVNSASANGFRVDTSSIFVSTNNRLYELLYKSYMLSEIYALAFNNKASSPKENIIRLSMQSPRYSLPEKFWERRGSSHELSNNLDYSYLFNPVGLRPETFLEQYRGYAEGLQAEFDRNLTVLHQFMDVLIQKDKARREQELSR